MSEYNLIDEPWIPVVDLKGNRIELGIKDTLFRSKELAGIEDDSPLVVASLYRFLLAVLYRALMGPTDIGEAKKLFLEGLPQDKIEAYLEKWRDRFYLFDDEYPFGQIAEFKPRTWRAWTALSTQHNADNAKVLLDHSDINSISPISLNLCARLILSTQTFSVSCGKSEIAHTSTGPSASSMLVIPQGRSLKDTLVFLLTPQNVELMKVDSVFWEQSPESIPKLKSEFKRIPSGISDLYTFRSRAIRIIKGSPVSVSKVGLASGLAVKENNITDPMLAFRIDKEQGALPIQLKERGMWRDFDSLIPDSLGYAPKVIENAIKLSRYDNTKFPKSILILGQCNNKAKIVFWRKEEHILPRALLENVDLKAEINELLQAAEKRGSQLWEACSLYARSVLCRGERIPDNKDIRRIINKMQPIPIYWSKLEQHFSQILSEFNTFDDCEFIKCKWLTIIRDSIYQAWNTHVKSIKYGDAWSIRALAKSQGPIAKAIAELNDEIKRYKEN